MCAYVCEKERCKTQEGMEGEENANMTFRENVCSTHDDNEMKASWFVLSLACLPRVAIPRARWGHSASRRRHRREVSA